MASRVTQSDFEALVRRAELHLTPAQVEHLYEAWEYVEPMLQRVRSHGRGRQAEPALIFRPEELP